MEKGEIEEETWSKMKQSQAWEREGVMGDPVKSL